MSRPTDIERGAHLAAAIALRELQPQLFERDVPAEFWVGIIHAAEAQLAECCACRDALKAAA